MNINNIILILLGLILILGFVLMLSDNSNVTTTTLNRLTANNVSTKPEKTIEGFDPVIDAIQNKLQSENPEELKSTIQALQQRLIDYGYAPDLNQYVKKTQLGPNEGKCLVAVAEDRDKYVSKADVPPPGPRIDLSQYVKKSSIPPEKVCPPTPTVDLSAYVKKSTLPPNEKCPPCISPMVKVSAGLCRECPPPPPCPAPAPCPACNCPPPAPCPTLKECKKCDEIRYIKVPTVITKTVMLDSNGNIISQKIDSGVTDTTTTAAAATTTTIPTTTTNPTTTSPTTTRPVQLQPSTTLQCNTLNSNIPSTTFPTMTNIAQLNLAQTLASTGNTGTASAMCPSAELNSNFSSYGITGRNESNFIY